MLPGCLPERSLAARLGVAFSCAEGSAGASTAVCLRCRGVYGMPLLRDFLRRRCAWSELAAESTRSPRETRIGKERVRRCVWRHQRTTPRVSLHAMGASLATAPSTCSIATVTRGMTRLHDLARFQVARHSNPTLSIGVPWCLVARKLGKPMRSLCPRLVSVSAGAS